jgi:hypothetical protein
MQGAEQRRMHSNCSQRFSEQVATKGTYHVSEIASKRLQLRHILQANQNRVAVHCRSTTSCDFQDEVGRSKAINRQVTSAANHGDLHSLLKVVCTYLPEMNGINLATSLHRVAKLSAASESSEAIDSIKADHRFMRLFVAVAQHVAHHSGLTRKEIASEVPGEMPAQCLSIVAWSCASLRIRDEELFAKIATIAVPRLDKLQSFELSNMLWAHAKLQISAPHMFKKASERLMRRRDGEFNVQCLSTISWSFATTHRRDGAVFESIAKELMAHAASAKPQEISQTLWAFAKNGHDDQVLFDVLGKAAVGTGSKISHFKEQELSNIAWAFATSGNENVELFAHIELAVLSKIAGMTPQSIANILWAFAKSAVQLQTRMFPMLLERAMARQKQFKPEELSAVVWAASQVCPQDCSFFAVAQQACMKRLPEFTANAIANLVNTFSSVQTKTSGPFVRIVQECLKRLPQLGVRALCNALEGLSLARNATVYASAAEEIDTAIDCVCDHIALVISSFKPFEVQLVHGILFEHRAVLGMKTAGSLDVVVGKQVGCSWRGASQLETGGDDAVSVASLSTTGSDSCSYTEGEDTASVSMNGSCEDSLRMETPTSASETDQLGFSLVEHALECEGTEYSPSHVPLTSLSEPLASFARGSQHMYGSLSQDKCTRIFDELPWKVAFPGGFQRNPCWLLPCQ